MNSGRAKKKRRPDCCPADNLALNRKEMKRVRTEESQAGVGGLSPDILFVSKAKRELNQGRYSDSERKRHPNLGRARQGPCS